MKEFFKIWFKYFCRAAIIIVSVVIFVIPLILINKYFDDALKEIICIVLWGVFWVVTTGALITTFMKDE